MYRIAIALILVTLSACTEPAAPSSEPDGGRGTSAAWVSESTVPSGLLGPSDVWVTEQYDGAFFCSGEGMRLGTIAEIGSACKTRFTNQGGFELQCTASDGYVDSNGNEYPGEYPSGLVSRPICVSHGL